MIDRQALQGFDIGNKTAAVIGCGGLGCNVATHLICAGIGKLILCDSDVVSESNLNRQFLYKADDIGKEKVFLAAKRLRAILPQAEVTAVSKKIEKPEDLNFAADADIVFLAVDNNKARKTVQDFCLSENIPLVNGGVNGFFGTAYLWIPYKAKDITSAGLLFSENGKTLSVSSTVGVIGALEAHLGIKYLTGDTQAAGYLYVFDGGEIKKLKIQ
ncbi:MAG: ThiF family adenylyltransferase [Clostridia bacterium]|nr:ThiF family adenylyltransferase [Clostridia bacterium]